LGSLKLFHLIQNTANVKNKMAAGSQNVFLFTIIVALIGLVLAFLICREVMDSIHWCFKKKTSGIISISFFQLG